jgi:hypothetical protein
LLLGDLVDFLQRAGCVVHAKNGHAVLVSLPESIRRDAAQLELDVYLRLFETLHPGTRAQRMGR